jgi:hypothetical protein
MKPLDYEALLLKPCRDAEALHAWVRLFCGLDVPRVAVCAGHDAPFDYLCRAYFEPASDLVVWAPRGGGKTRLAAVATLLDLLHKPGTSVRILGGSLEQSMKMLDYLLPDLHRLAKRHLKKTRGRLITLDHGGNVAVLPQSQRSVRGLRVQKLRCDEVELFDPDVWEAAQLVTKSAGGVRGAVEALSTHHAVGGLMRRVIDEAKTHDVPVMRWCLLDVLESCPAERDCEECALHDDCGGRAKRAGGGWVTRDDAVAMKRRVSLETWQSEMLCQRPSTRGRVFPTFDVDRHVKEFEPPAGRWSLGMDFGFAAPTVALWIVDDGRAAWVIDEHIEAGRTLEQHVRLIAERPWPTARDIACDPAGLQRNSHTATSDVALLRQHGHRVRCRPSRITAGLELIRRALQPAEGEPRLVIHPRCVGLIRALQGYRYPPTGGELPLKDGDHDHAVDALRYWFVNQPTREVATDRIY